MPKIDTTNSKKFDALLLALMRAKVKLAKHEIAARNAGDFTRADALFAARVGLQDQTVEVAKAQNAFLFSTVQIGELTARLAGVVEKMQAAQKKMLTAHDALESAAKIATLLAGLAGLLA